MAPREAYPAVRAGVFRAIELDDTIAETHDLMGRLQMWFEWDLKTAEQAFQRAIQLNANYADVRVFYAWLLNTVKRWTEAKTQIVRALELDPLNAFFQSSLGFGLFLQRRYNDAIDQFRRTLRMDPGVLLAHSGLWISLHQKNMYDEALREAKKYFEALEDQEVTDALTNGFAEGGHARSMHLAADTHGAAVQSDLRPTNTGCSTCMLTPMKATWRSSGSKRRMQSATSRSFTCPFTPSWDESALRPAVPGSAGSREVGTRSLAQ